MNDSKLFSKYTLEIVLIFFIIGFMVLTGLKVLTGTSADDVEKETIVLEETKSKKVLTDEKDILTLREKRVSEIEAVDKTIREDLDALMTNKDYDLFQETYGKESRVVLESELANGNHATLTVLNQPLYFSDDSYPIDIVLDDKVHIFMNYQFENGSLQPAYVSRTEVTE